MQHIKSIETLNLGLTSGAGTPPVTHQFGETQTILDANSTPVATQTWAEIVPLVGGTITLDLAALKVGAGTLPNINMTGEKVQAYYIKNNGTNVMVFKPLDAVTGYNLFGDADGQLTLAAGESDLCLRNESLPDVAAGAKDLLVTGTGEQTFEMMLISS
jgi:hypothetical protein